jgi:hypothetical protein
MTTFSSLVESGAVCAYAPQAGASWITAMAMAAFCGVLNWSSPALFFYNPQLLLVHHKLTLMRATNK